MLFFFSFCAAPAARAAPYEAAESLVELSKPSMVIPGGQSIGVIMSTEGVSVVGFSSVVVESGALQNPAEAAGLRIGDFITTVNDEAITSNQQMIDLVDQIGASGENCLVEYFRSGIRETVEVEPLYCTDSQTWRIGLYVRDNTAGVGTLTYYDPASLSYGALGHTVSGLDYGVEEGELGEVIRASVQGIRAGAAGVPGEKLGVFLSDEWQGDIMANGLFGIYGSLQNAPTPGYSDIAIPIAEPGQVETGPAQIYTVINGEKVEAFSINIVKIMENYKSTGRGMIVEVTDPKLIEAASGIVQGMSGSPIIQKGMLAGAVTHVFVNDPIYGYACFAQWMWEEAEASLAR